jgi:hypothetical protein
MAALTLNNLPDDLLHRLQERAAELDEVSKQSPLCVSTWQTRERQQSNDVERTLAELKRFRDSLDPKLRVDEQGLSAARCEGRP